MSMRHRSIISTTVPIIPRHSRTQIRLSVTRHLHLDPSPLPRRRLVLLLWRRLVLLLRRRTRTSSSLGSKQPPLNPLLGGKVPTLWPTSALLWMVLLVGKHLRLHSGRGGSRARVLANLRTLLDRRVKDIAETGA